MPETDLAVLIAAAQAAGEVVGKFNGPNTKQWYKPNDAGPVSEADLAVNDVLLAHLTRARPDYGWLSEETEDNSKRLQAERVFIVDPIDGTRSFINGEKTWSHALAVVERGEVIAGVVYLPMLDKFYTAARGQGAYLNGERLQISNCQNMCGAQILSTRANLEPQHWRTVVPKFQHHHRPSLAYRLALVAQGKFDAMLTFRDSWEWDIAAGALLAAEAGATISDKTGAALRFNSPAAQTRGIVVAGPELYAQIVSRLA